MTMLETKRGQFFAIYLVLLTLFMCAVSVWLYYYQNETVKNEVMSPEDILEIKEKISNFESAEKEIITQSIIESDLINKKDVSLFKEKFVANAVKNEKYSKFVFSGLNFNGNEVNEETIASEDSKKSVLMQAYSFEYSVNKISVERKGLGKFFMIKAEDKMKINFPVKIYYDYSRKYDYVLSEEVKYG